jgi:hypothetical protein
MGALADFIAREIGGVERGSTHEIETSRAAKVAKPAKVPPETPNFSNFSNFSRGLIPKSAPREEPDIHRCACGSIGMIGTGWFLRGPSRERWYCSSCFERLRAEGRA